MESKQEVDMSIFKNRQWAVTDYGVETIEGQPSEYHFEAKRLLETGKADRDEFYTWPVQLAEKTWVDIEAFSEVFIKAIDIHKNKYTGEVDQKMLSASIEKARDIAKRRTS
jgi:hypothetical protein